ncbi:tetratricopeptide repeat protein [Chiayiivirga flava]|uniref:protein O-GlcNAc transferase n=1 Tax=Chiayiivirga flava TaxID=659595 RepID=A0A7W8D6I7_9GAMM|nr:tetratricopeptide repeat protein [Chiayiivirga flava]MBB5208841.1 putative O-linked N-acetylglucosamine transferase (SPINDLY family) [Chiayiivirga flava]
MTAAAAFEAARRAHLQQRLDEAQTLYRQVLETTPDHAAAWHYLGLVLHQRGEPGAALDAYARATALAPGRIDTRILATMLLRDLGRIREALDTIAAVLAVQPRNALALNLRGALLLLSGDVSQAETALRAALAIDPQLAEAWHHLGIALHRQRRWRDALGCYRTAAARGATGYQLQHNIALAAEAVGEFDAAVTALHAALRAVPGNASGWAHLANIHALRCDFVAADAAFARLDALLQQPADGADALVEPFLLLFAPLSAPARAEALRRYVAQVERQTAHLARPQRSPHAGSRLRIGYLSPDFGEHAVGGLVRDLFAAHDRSGFDIAGYSLRRHEGDTAARIRAGCDLFRDVEAQSTEAIAAQIAADGIDILVDLGGYTLGARPGVLALRPAPVQIGWLGFLHTHAAPFIDAIVLDEFVAPPAQHHLYAERVLTLSGSLFPGSGYPAPRAATRARFGLPHDRFVFASFNNSYKLDAPLLDAWARIARGAPDAVFALYLPDAARAGVSRAWTERGLAAERLLLLPKLGLAEHIDRAACCDLFLDAFRYQAGATAMASAAAGLPTLCVAGQGAAARLSVSINGALGLHELVVDSADAYVDAAIALAQTPARLAALRERLAAARTASGLFDPRRAATALEAVYRRIAAR